MCLSTTALSLETGAMITRKLRAPVRVLVLPASGGEVQNHSPSPLNFWFRIDVSLPLQVQAAVVENSLANQNGPQYQRHS